MKSFKRSVKALSPVVASIILIAVTVAVSIAVAAWMGALTFNFTSTEQVKITTVIFTGTSPYTVVNCTVTNTGPSDVTINGAYVNGLAATIAQTTVPKNTAAQVIQVTYASGAQWISGGTYQIKLMSAKGNSFMYNAVAP